MIAPRVEGPPGTTPVRMVNSTKLAIRGSRSAPSVKCGHFRDRKQAASHEKDRDHQRNGGKVDERKYPSRSGVNSGRGAFPLAQVQHMNERYLDHCEKNKDKARQEYPIEESQVADPRQISFDRK